MENTEKKSNSKNWTLFFISTIVMIALLFVKPEWFWLALPFSLTYFSEAMNYL